MTELINLKLKLMAKDIAHDEIGIYPQATTDEEGKTTKRTLWEDGHNAAVIGLSKLEVRIEKWMSGLPLKHKEIIIELYENEAITIHINDNDIALAIVCSDLFMWGCYDTEDLSFDELEEIYYCYNKDKSWGTDKWCCIKRGYKPQEIIIDRMKTAGVWDDIMEGLK